MAINTSPVQNNTGFTRYGNTTTIELANVNFITDTELVIALPQQDSDKIFVLNAIVDMVNVKGTLSQNAIATLDTGTTGQTIASSTTFTSAATNRYTLMAIPANARTIYGSADTQEVRLLITQKAIGQATTTVARTDNIVLLTTGAAHGLVAGDIVEVASLADATLNGRVTVIDVPSATTFTYYAAGPDVVSGADTAGRVGAFDANIILQALLLGVNE